MKPFLTLSFLRKQEPTDEDGFRVVPGIPNF